MPSLSMRFIAGGLVACLCTTGPLSAQPTRKPAEGAAVAVSDASPDPLVDALIAANLEAAADDPLAATLTSASPIVIPVASSAGISGPYPAQRAVSGLPNAIGRLEVRLNHFSHTYPQDIDVLLVGPGGQNVMLMSDVGADGAVEGLYLTVADGAPAMPTSSALTSGRYAPTNTVNNDELPAPAPAGPHGTSLSSFVGTDPNGLWSLYVFDDSALDTGRLYGFSLIITPRYPNTTPVPIPDVSTIESSIVVAGLTRPITKVTVGLHITHTWDADLDISLIGPDGTLVVLSSDNGGSSDNYGTSCAPAQQTTFDDDAGPSITSAAAPFVGSFRSQDGLWPFDAKSANGTWKLRVTDDQSLDTGILRCWAISITTAEPVQPPSALSVTNMKGNLVTFRWMASPAGPPATSFVFEGGVTAGQVLATVPVGVPALTLNVPNGTFFVRVRSVAGGDISGASNELPIYVGVARLPSRPSNLLLSRNGSALELTWRNTFEGAAPTSVVLEVTGAVTTEVPLPLSERFVFNGVPDGSYTFAVRAVNGAGASAASDPKSATFPAPTPCTDVPGVPANFRAYAVGSTVFVDWDAPMVGAAVSQYVLRVSGALALAIPTAGRALSGAVPPGTYGLRVAAVNACGISVESAVATVTVP